MLTRAAFWTIGIRSALVALTGPAAWAQDYPVTVDVCGTPVRFEEAPRRPVVNDLNMVQTMIDLGLADRLVGVSGIGGLERFLAADEGTRGALRQFAERYPTFDAILGQDPDFVFMGWLYGFDQGRGVTPSALRDFGIRSYVLRESCIRVGPREPMSLEVMYADILALGKIFGMRKKTERMVADYRHRIAAVAARVASARHRPRVMYCGDCSSDNPPLSMGAEGMPRVIAEVAGGENIFNDVKDSYVRVSWEEVVLRNPEWILVSDSRIPAASSIAYLTSSPTLKEIDAVKNRRFFAVTYPQRSPSTRNVETIERFARALHPDLFKD